MQHVHFFKQKGAFVDCCHFPLQTGTYKDLCDLYK